MPPIVSFFGPPGCGKSTQGKMLANTKGWHHLSTGEALRALNNPWLNNHLAKGNFAPETMVTEIITKAITNLRSGIHFGLVLDGYPRTSHQVETMQHVVEIFGETHVEWLGMIHLTCTKAVAKQRTTLRVGRTDDAAFEQRWELYATKVAKIREECDHVGVPFHDVNAEASIEDIERYLYVLVKQWQI